MRIFFLTIVLLIGTTIYAQNQAEVKHVFIRVYNLYGQDIGHGKISSITDSGLVMVRGGDIFTINLRNIGKVKTKRTTSGIFKVAIAGSIATHLMIWGFNEPGLAIYFGVLQGLAIGTIVALINNRKSYYINGDKEVWDLFHSLLLK